MKVPLLQTYVYFYNVVSETWTIHCDLIPWTEHGLTVNETLGGL